MVYGYGYDIGYGGGLGLGLGGIWDIGYSYLPTVYDVVTPMIGGIGYGLYDYDLFDPLWAFQKTTSEPEVSEEEAADLLNGNPSTSSSHLTTLLVTSLLMLS
jgi:hypothetical protein